MKVRAPALRPEPPAATALAATLGAALLALLPPGGDTSAHLYRTDLVEEGVLLWDTFWFGGHYPLAGYSLVYHPAAALVGNVPLALAASALGAGVFASIALRQWGSRGRWPALAFALLAPAPLVLGQWPYAVGLAAALLGVRALQSDRMWVVAAAGLAALATSPLAFGVLVLALGGALLTRPRLGRRHAALAASLGLAVAAYVAAGRAFPAEHAFPFPRTQFALALVAAGFVAALGLVRARPDAATGAVTLFAVAVVAAFLVPLSLGENVTRPRELLFPVALGLALQARFRPVWLTLPAVAVALAWGAFPYLDFVRGAPLSREHDEAFWREPLELLDRERSADFRVEFVPTASHWEALYVPRAGHPLARGWFRQLDLAQNAVLYTPALAPAVYRAWLRANAVRFVVLPRFRLDQRGAAAEARLLRSGRSGLEPVLESRAWTVYELPNPTPLLTGPGTARVDVLAHDRVRGFVGAPGAYRLRVGHTPYWRVASGDVCVERSPRGDVVVNATRAGEFELVADAGLSAIVAAAAGRRGASCR